MRSLRSLATAVQFKPQHLVSLMTARNPVASLVITALLLGSGCKSKDTPASRKDENHAATPTQWTLAEEPFLRIGSADDKDTTAQFGNVAGAFRLPGGRIVTVDSWTSTLSFFSETGQLVGRAGRVGTGPGEFHPRSGMFPVVCGTDSVYVSTYDRVLVFVAPGTYVREFRLSPQAQVSACNGPHLVALGRHGEWRSEAGLFTDSSVVSLYGLDGSMISVVDTVPSEQRQWVTGAEGVGYSAQPFGNKLRVTGSEAQFAFGYSGDRDIRIVGRDSTWSIKSPANSRKVSGEDTEKFWEYVGTPWRGNESEKKALQTQLKEVEGLPYPLFGALLIDGGGQLWVRQFDEKDAVAFYDYSEMFRGAKPLLLTQPRNWIVMAPDGKHIASIALPPQFDLRQVGSDWALGIWRGELDVQEIRMYRVNKSTDSHGPA